MSAIRQRTAREEMFNNAFKWNGTGSPAIRPARRAILSIIQSVRPTRWHDDQVTWVHFNARYGGAS